MLINNTSSTLRLVSKQCLYFVLPHTTPVRINGEPYASKFHHMYGRGFMIPRVILIFIKCLSANQNQLFYMKV